VVPSERIINAPSRNRKMRIGASHHFLRSLRNDQNSKIIDNLFINSALYHRVPVDRVLLYITF